MAKKDRARLEAQTRRLEQEDRKRRDAEAGAATAKRRNRELERSARMLERHRDEVQTKREEVEADLEDVRGVLRTVSADRYRALKRLRVLVGLRENLIALIEKLIDDGAVLTKGAAEDLRVAVARAKETRDVTGSAEPEDADAGDQEDSIGLRNKRIGQLIESRAILVTAIERAMHPDRDLPESVRAELCDAVTKAKDPALWGGGALTMQRFGEIVKEVAPKLAAQQEAAAAELEELDRVGSARVMERVDETPEDDLEELVAGPGVAPGPTPDEKAYYLGEPVEGGYRFVKVDRSITDLLERTDQVEMERRLGEAIQRQARAIKNQAFELADLREEVDTLRATARIAVTAVEHTQPALKALKRLAEKSSREPEPEAGEMSGPDGIGR